MKMIIKEAEKMNDKETDEVETMTEKEKEEETYLWRKILWLLMV